MWGCIRWPDCDGAINIDPAGTRTVSGEDASAKVGLPNKGAPGAYAQRRADQERKRARLKRRAALPLIVGTACIVMWGAFLALQGFGVTVAGTAAVVVGAGFALSLFRLPFDTLVWAKGAEGERRAAVYIDPLIEAGFVVLYNRLIPGIKADIDSLVIGPTGVFPIETKFWSGKVEVRNERLFVGEHDRTWVVQQVYREALAVQVALGEELTRERITVTPVICAIGGVASIQKVASGVYVTDGKGLTRLLADRAQILDEEAVQRIARLADRHLRAPYDWEVSGTN
jgi:Nuclease-related domain.